MNHFPTAYIFSSVQPIASRPICQRGESTGVDEDEEELDDDEEIADDSQNNTALPKIDLSIAAYNASNLPVRCARISSIALQHPQPMYAFVPPYLSEYAFNNLPVQPSEGIAIPQQPISSQQEQINLPEPNAATHLFDRVIPGDHLTRDTVSTIHRRYQQLPKDQPKQSASGSRSTISYLYEHSSRASSSRKVPVNYEELEAELTGYRDSSTYLPVKRFRTTLTTDPVPRNGNPAALLPFFGTDPSLEYPPSNNDLNHFSSSYGTAALIPRDRQPSAPLPSFKFEPKNEYNSSSPSYGAGSELQQALPSPTSSAPLQEVYSQPNRPPLEFLFDNPIVSFYMLKNGAVSWPGRDIDRVFIAHEWLIGQDYLVKIEFQKFNWQNQNAEAIRQKWDFWKYSMEAGTIRGPDGEVLFSPDM